MTVPAVWQQGNGLAVVLMYHRIATPSTDPWSLSVTPEQFEEHLQILRRISRPVRMRDLAESLANGLTDRMSAITFDDGYSDNLFNAVPLLERYELPATVFLATGFLGSDREFWWDELERIFLQPGVLPATLHLEFPDGHRRWELGDVKAYDEADFDRNRGWKADDRPPTARHGLYRSLWQALQCMPASEQQQVLSQILTWAAASAAARPGNRPLRPEEVAAISTSELIEIGAHTVTHPLLSTLSDNSQRTEIESSKARTEEIIGQPIESFTYPYGNFTSHSIQILRDNGFTSACGTAPGAVLNDADPFRLSRIHVENWSGEDFERRVSSWFAA